MLSVLERELSTVWQRMRVTHGCFVEFGVCQGCGQRISSKRLKALPDSDRCIGCQQDRERGERV